jgi:phage shock protein C
MGVQKIMQKQKIYTENKLVKSEEDKMVWGVCAGIADYLDVDVTLVRLAFVLLTLAGGPGLIAYIIMAIVMPDA